MNPTAKVVASRCDGACGGFSGDGNRGVGVYGGFLGGGNRGGNLYGAISGDGNWGADGRAAILGGGYLATGARGVILEDRNRGTLARGAILGDRNRGTLAREAISGCQDRRAAGIFLLSLRQISLPSLRGSASLGTYHSAIMLMVFLERKHIMPTYNPPSSDPDRLSTLETIFTTSAADTIDARRLPAEDRTKIGTFLTSYRPVVQKLIEVLAERAREVSEKDKAQAKLEMYVRDFLAVLKRRTERLEHEVAVLVHYGLPQSGDVPKIYAAADVVKAAGDIIAGESKAVEAGFPAMANPSAAEVDAVLKAYQEEAEDVAPADTAVREAQVAAAKFRLEADELIDDAKASISYSMRKESAPAVRRVLRLFGFKFTPNPGEAPEEEPPPAPVG